MTLKAALDTARRIKRRRESARDPGLAFFTPTLSDDDDIDHVVAYLANSYASPPPQLSRDLLVEELPDRALLIEYQHQRDVLQHKRRLLAILEAGHRLGAAATSYGPNLGLPTRSAVSNRRRSLAIELRLAGQSPPTKHETRRQQELRRWLSANHATLRDLCSVLTDHRDDLIALAESEVARQHLREYIDGAGELEGHKPNMPFAAHVLGAVGLLSRLGNVLDDEDVRVTLRRGSALRAEYSALTPAARRG